MRPHRFHFLALLLALLLALAAGCGGGDDGEEAQETQPAGEEAQVNEDVSGELTLAGLWTGGEGESFQAVLDGFQEQYPNVTVNYQAAGDNLPTVLATSVEGGNPPDLAALSSPGLMRQFIDRGALQPVNDEVRSAIEENYSEGFIELATVENQLYGVVFKGANKSTIWYNVQIFNDAGVEPPETWDDLLQAAETIKAFGVPAWSIGASEGWTLTDLFENIYLRTAGPDLYDQLAAHEIPWTHQSVKDALAEMVKIIGDSDNIAGGTSGALQTDFPTSVTQVFTDPPEAAMVIEADFVQTFIETETQATIPDQANVFTFPSVNDSPPVVVGAGDTIVMFKDSEAAQALLAYLATPEAAAIWAERGGFSSPNQNVDPEAYQDETVRKLATEMAQAETFRFDLSDLQPQTLNDALFAQLAQLVETPDDIDGVTRRLEQIARRAYQQ
jgi:alpha-glucoside transport system substrate-binding protein